MIVGVLLIRCPKTVSTAKSEALHIISKGKSQLGLCKIGASTYYCFSYIKACFPSSSMMKSFSLHKREVSGFKTLEKSLKKRRKKPTCKRKLLSSLINYGSVMQRINAAVHCTPIRVNNIAKLTNLMKISRIEWYNGK